MVNVVIIWEIGLTQKTGSGQIVLGYVLVDFPGTLRRHDHVDFVIGFVAILVRFLASSCFGIASPLAHVMLLQKARSRVPSATVF